MEAAEPSNRLTCVAIDELSLGASVQVKLVFPDCFIRRDSRFIKAAERKTRIQPLRSQATKANPLL